MIGEEIQKTKEKRKVMMKLKKWVVALLAMGKFISR